MHNNVKIFCEKVKGKFLSHFTDSMVLDVGSLDINGNNRYLFTDCSYTGIDIIEGRNVDIVQPVHRLIGSYDVIISTEAFEHDMHLEDSLQNIIKMLNPHGLFLFTCATTGRKEHGTHTHHPELSVTSAVPGWHNYYKNVTQKMIEKAIDMSVFQDYEFSVVETDLQFWGIKK